MPGAGLPTGVEAVKLTIVGKVIVEVSAHNSMNDHLTWYQSSIRLLRGPDDRRPSYRWTRAIFLKGMGVAYLSAFWSLAVQADGLIGSRGIAPVGEFLDRVRLFLGADRYWQVPTVFWLGASDQVLHIVCWGGVVVSVLLIAGILAGECLVLLWLAYLSLVNVGSPFLDYQWDMLLLEAGLLAILLAPWGLLMDRARRGPSPMSIWLVRWLVFRLVFLSDCFTTSELLTTMLTISHQVGIILVLHFSERIPYASIQSLCVSKVSIGSRYVRFLRNAKP